MQRKRSMKRWNLFKTTFWNEDQLKKGTVKLYGESGKQYVNDALFVSGWVPCFRKLQDNVMTLSFLMQKI